MSTDQDALGQVQDALIEPRDNGQHWPSGLWTRDEMIALATQRQNRLLLDVLLTVRLASPQLAVSIGQSLINLPADWLRTITALWIGNDGTVTELQRSDSFEADHLLPTWQTTQGSPIIYMEDDLVGNLQIQIAPAPSVVGVIDLLYIPSGATLTGNGITLELPDDFLQALKYGILADALAKDGRGKDSARAQYCEQRVDLIKTAADIILRGWS